MLPCLRLHPALLPALVSFVLLPAATVLFAVGFFPYKPYLQGVAEFGSGPGSARRPGAVFDRVVVMVVDSLRSDFVFSPSSEMTFTQSLIRTGVAIPFTARASPPTVTMPKIKAITTGSVPSFLDVILNVAESDSSATLRDQDSWLVQLSRSGPRAGPRTEPEDEKRKGHSDDRHDGGTRKLVFYGDDTWLKLFPGLFSRHDGTTSFFVSDFTEVDTNVTRHLDRELAAPDWAGLILHYLGLDHIGHKTGSRGRHMGPKQREMDAVVARIYGAIEGGDGDGDGDKADNHLASTLLVLLGDHGMTDDGNHGGSSPGETSPALVFASPKLASLSHADGPAGTTACPTAPSHDFVFYSPPADQADLVPTLSALLGLPVPKNNVGVVLDRFLPLWPDRRDRLALARANAVQIGAIVRAKYASRVGDFAVVPDGGDGDGAADGDVAEVDCRHRPGRDDGERLACLWTRATRPANNVSVTDRTDRYLEFCREAKSVLSRASSDYKTGWMVSGLGVAAVATVLAGVGAVQATKPHRRSTSSGPSARSSSPSARSSSPSATSAPASPGFDALAWTALVGLHAATSFASSYVEAEGTFWNYMVATGLFLLTVAPPNPATEAGTGPRTGTRTAQLRAGLGLLLLHRIAADWPVRDSVVHSWVVRCPGALWACVVATFGWCVWLGMAPDRSVNRARNSSPAPASDPPSPPARSPAPPPDSASSFTSRSAGTVLRTVRAGAVVVPTAAALVFKAALTSHDAPELLAFSAGPGVGRADGWVVETLARVPLVPGARAAFALWAAGCVVLGLCAVSESGGGGDGGGGANCVLDTDGSLLAEANKDAGSARPASGTRRTDFSSRPEPRWCSFFPARWAVLVVLLMQTRVENVPLLAIWGLEEQILATHFDLGNHPVRVAGLGVALAHAAFFQSGRTNSIGSVDLSQGYNGLAGFAAGPVGLLVFVANWAGPIWWAVGAERLAGGSGGDGSGGGEGCTIVCSDCGSDRGSGGGMKGGDTTTTTAAITPPPPVSAPPLVSAGAAAFALRTGAAAAGLAGVMGASYLMRDHLFVWSVFSPKFLFAAAWTVGYHCLVLGPVRAVGWWVGR